MILRPIVIAAIAALLILVGTIVYFIKSTRPKKQVLLLRPRDKRGIEVPIERESDTIIECKDIDGVARRFVKAGGAWTFTIGRRIVTRFLALEGTAYTAILKNKNKVEVPIYEALQGLWGKKFYNEIPKNKRTALEKSRWGLTVEVEPIPLDEKMKAISPDIVDMSLEANVLERFAGKLKVPKSQNIYNFIMGAVAGALIVFLAATQGWIII